MEEKLYVAVEDKEDRVLDVYDENVITPNDFSVKIDEIIAFTRKCTVADLKILFESAMRAKGVEQDMSKFEPFCLNYADLFIRQIVSVVKELDYDTMLEFHVHVSSLTV